MNRTNLNSVEIYRKMDYVQNAQLVLFLIVLGIEWDDIFTQIFDIDRTILTCLKLTDVGFFPSQM